jgi:p-cumate 2,3-dioxygenase subunit beta
MSKTIGTAETVNREQIEDFIYLELELLDDWKLMEWVELFAEQGLYLVPTMNTKSDDYKTTLFIVADERIRIRERAIRLLKKESHIEYPHSKTRHLVTNIRLVHVEDGIILVNCNFIVYRTKREVLDPYIGQYNYKFVIENGMLRILEKRVRLSMDSLRPNGKLSIIL